MEKPAHQKPSDQEPALYSDKLVRSSTSAEVIDTDDEQLDRCFGEDEGHAGEDPGTGGERQTGEGEGPLLRCIWEAEI